MLRKGEQCIWCIDGEMKVCYPQACLCGRNTLVTRLLCRVIMWLWRNCIFSHHTHEGGELGKGGGGPSDPLFIWLWPLVDLCAVLWQVVGGDWLYSVNARGFYAVTWGSVPEAMCLIQTENRNSLPFLNLLQQLYGTLFRSSPDGRVCSMLLHTSWALQRFSCN